MLLIWLYHTHMADSRLAPSQWETALQSNAVSHWLGANLEAALHTHTTHEGMLHSVNVLCVCMCVCVWPFTLSVHLCIHLWFLMSPLQHRPLPRTLKSRHYRPPNVTLPVAAETCKQSRHVRFRSNIHQSTHFGWKLLTTFKTTLVLQTMC